MIFTYVSVSIAQLMVFTAFISVFLSIFPSVAMHFTCSNFFFNAQTYMCFGSCYGRLIVYAVNYSGYIVKFRNQINYMCNIQK